MHPAYSVILFTTASGAGYGLLVWLSLFAAAGVIPAERWLGIVGLGLALGLVSTGLLASTFHLGHPERAWRAFSQWRSSWLSREGVAAVATYLPAGLLAMGWVLLESVRGGWAIAAGLSIVGALITVWCTGMIYASLRTIRQWHQALVPWVYLTLALATGAVLLTLLLGLFGYETAAPGGLAIVMLIVAAAVKFIYWRRIDTAEPRYTAESATGLGHLGEVRALEPAHTRPNFVMREMGYRVARKHVRRLRTLALLFGFVLPIAALFLALLGSGGLAIVAALFATLSAALGVVIERWLFFAEAQHVVTLYYGASAA